MAGEGGHARVLGGTQLAAIVGGAFVVHPDREQPVKCGRKLMAHEISAAIARPGQRENLEVQTRVTHLPKAAALVARSFCNREQTSSHSLNSDSSAMK